MLIKISVRLVKFALPIFFGILLSGCSTWPRNSEAEQKMALADIVDSVQYAVDIAASDKAWLATEQELKHWNLACKAAKSQASQACIVMADAAAPLCKALCLGGNCNPSEQQRCEQYVKGQQISGLCVPGIDAQRSVWCAEAVNCAGKLVSSAEVCANADSLVLPELQKAELSLAVEKSQNLSANASLLIVSFGGNRTETSSNVINMTLRPRIRSTAYGSTSISVKIPKDRVISEQARLLSAQLSSLIRDAVAASVKEYDLGAGVTDKVIARAPMLMSELEITFSLVIDSNGTLGIKKAWGMPAGIELGGGKGQKRSNSITIYFSRL